MKKETKIYFKLFLIDFIFELVINSIILFIAYISDKFIEIFSFYLSWNVFRYSFPEIFHFKSDKPICSIIGCALCSCACYIIAIKFITHIGISIFSSVVVGIIINYSLFKIQDYIQLKKKIGEQTIDVYQMSEETLRNYAKSKGLSEMIIDTLVLKVIYNYKWVEIQKERSYSKDGIRYHKKRIKELLQIEL